MIRRPRLLLEYDDKLRMSQLSCPSPAPFCRQPMSKGNQGDGSGAIEREIQDTEWDITFATVGCCKVLIVEQNGSLQE